MEKNFWKCEHGMVGTEGTHCPECEKEWTDLDAMVRDFTAVGYRPKSEVRARIKAYAKKCVAGAFDEALNSGDGIYNP